MRMNFALVFVLSTPVTQPPVVVPPTAPQPPTVGARPVMPPDAGPSRGGMPGGVMATPQFKTGVFPFGATMAIADHNGNLSVELVFSEFVPETALRSVPFRGPEGRTEYRTETYTVMKSVFKSVKRTLSPDIKIYRGGRELTADEKRGLGSPTPIFITSMGAPDRAPGQGYESLLRDSLVAYVPATSNFGAPGMGGSAPSPRANQAGYFITGTVSRIDAQSGVVWIAAEKEVQIPEERIEIRVETRTVAVNGETRQQTVNVPVKTIVTTTRKVTKEIGWNASSGLAYELNGRSITPAVNAIQRLQSGDAVLWSDAPLPPDAFSQPLPSGKLVLANSAVPSTPMMRRPEPVIPGANPSVPSSAPRQDFGDASAAEREVIEKANAERATAGLPPFKIDATLMKAARQHSANMAKQGKLDHVLDNKGPGERLADLGMRPTFTGENCAQGQQTGAEAMQSWMGSEGHRGNILNPAYTHIGVGKADGENGPYWTQVFAQIGGQ